MTTALSVNVNAIAFLRNRRDLPWPSVEGIGKIALEAGAEGLTVHPRPDQRHIRFSDVPVLRALIDTFPKAEFNIEGYPTRQFLDLCIAGRADQVTLVPDDPSQATSDHGWDFAAHKAFLTETIKELKDHGIRVSCFADGDGSEAAMDVAQAVGTDRIELYTGPYGGCYADPAAAKRQLDLLGRTADAALARGIDVNAGHDLTVANLPALIARIPKLAEVSIGHDLTADALIHGMAETVRRFRRACGHSV